jgi:hypothetical protein
MKERLSNYGLWVAIASLVGMILTDTVDGFSMGRYNEYVQTLFGIFIVAGLISNPKEGKWFGDQK